ncbi:MAG: RNA methyltransferase, partial [Candidatus Colwellbacteria bacterium]|nr:RNA methyltransferase [Candidatus Colwellbacteria bacterium]
GQLRVVELGRDPGLLDAPAVERESVLPVLHDPERPAGALARTRGCAERLFFHPGAPLFSEWRGGKSSRAAGARRGVFTGPEGGWSEAEVELARMEGCVFSGLGALTLRAETAAIVASYLAAHCGEPHRGRL